MPQGIQSGQDVTGLMLGGAAPQSGDDVTHLMSSAATPPPGMLGASSKPSHIGGPPSFGEVIRSSLPMLGAATGAALGTEAGPAGMGVGAYLGGHAGKGVQQVAGALGYGPPPPTTVAGQEAARSNAGTEQAAYEAGGQAAAWPLNAAMRGSIGKTLSKETADSLAATRTATTSRLQSALDAAQTVLGKSKAAKAETVQSARALGAEGVQGAQEASRAGVVGAKAQTADELAAAQQALPQTPAVTPMQATHHVAAAVRGPVQASKNKLGQAVEEAAQSGPDVNWAPIKAKVQAMVANTQPATTAGADDISRTYTELTGSSGANVKPAEKASFLQRAGVSVEAEHPLPGVLHQIGDAPDTVSFSDAHKYKRMLDDAVNWESPAKKQVQQVTKGVRGDIRGAMVGHAPYDQATAAYQQVAQLSSDKQLGQKLVKVAQGSPGDLVSMINPKQPVRTQMLFDLLQQHGGEQGQAAVDSVRAAWTHEKLVSGPIESLSSRIQALPPEFEQAFYGDASGQRVLGNLRNIGSAVDNIVSRGEEGVAAARDTGRAAVTSAKQQATQTTTQAVTGANRAVTHNADQVTGARQALAASKPPTGNEQAFLKSAIAPPPPAPHPAVQVLDLLTSSKIGMAKKAVKWLKSPAGTDLVQWASYGSPRTQRLIQALNSPTPSAGLANLARSAGLAYQGLHEEQTIAPMAAHPQPGGPPAPAPVPAP